MHLIHDENGNLCPHTHDHEHTHQHTYEHSHPHSHEHGHEEDHNHTHDHGEHTHTGCETDCQKGSCEGCAQAQEATPAQKQAALLDYMLKHNEHHAAELDQVADKLRAEGNEKAAEQIKKAVDEFQKGNLYLSLALSLVKEQ